MMTRGVVLAAVFLLAAGCSQAPPAPVPAEEGAGGSRGTGGGGDEDAYALATRPGVPHPYTLTLRAGHLVRRNGCLVIQAGSPTAVVWPPGFRAGLTSRGTVVVRDRAGRPVGITSRPFSGHGRLLRSAQVSWPASCRPQPRWEVLRVVRPVLEAREYPSDPLFLRPGECGSNILRFHGSRWIADQITYAPDSVPVRFSGIGRIVQRPTGAVYRDAGGEIVQIRSTAATRLGCQ